MIRRPPRSTHCISSAASDVYKRQILEDSKLYSPFMGHQRHKMKLNLLKRKYIEETDSTNCLFNEDKYLAVPNSCKVQTSEIDSSHNKKGITNEISNMLNSSDVSMINSRNCGYIRNKSMLRLASNFFNNFLDLNSKHSNIAGSESSEKSLFIDGHSNNLHNKICFADRLLHWKRRFYASRNFGVIKNLLYDHCSQADSEIKKDRKHKPIDIETYCLLKRLAKNSIFLPNLRARQNFVKNSLTQDNMLPELGRSFRGKRPLATDQRDSRKQLINLLNSQLIENPTIRSTPHKIVIPPCTNRDPLN
eukprot:TRINITY_DN13244_c0_g2_i3.p1 TRINITY_DN13244_c0_g2~~TRINITY_DN13244_c0_g2_i3.p1  ORF type:complete len:313 (-),score=22.01 TRINITY_DN13244_c0_g2_i3:133-1047(-)